MKRLIISLILSVPLITEAQSIDSLILKDDLAGLLPMVTDENRQQIFHQSIAAGAMEIVADLLDQDVKINQLSADGNPPIMDAIAVKNPAMVKLLLAKGADPNLHQNGDLQASPLMYAAGYNDIASISNLLESESSINDVDINGDPAINWASYYGYTGAMRALMDAGADLTIKSKHGMPADVVFRLWHADTVAKVFREAGFGETLSKGVKVLAQSVRSNDITTADKWIDKGISVNSRDELGTPLLHSAAEQGNLPLLRYLIDRGADVNAVNRVGQTALAIAARFGQLSVVKYLLEQSADANLAGEEYKLTPLMGAAIAGQIAIGKLLIENGANPNQKDVVNKATALHQALWYRQADFAKMLLDQGADPKLVTAYGNSAKKLAELLRLEQVLAKIKESENPMLGIWRIDQISYVYQDTTIRLDLNYKGRLMVSKDYYSIMYNPYGSTRDIPLDLGEMTDEEKLYSFHTIVFNSGTYEMADSVFVTTADMAKVAGFEGGIQYYLVTKDSQHMTLTMYDETYPNGKKPKWYRNLKIMFTLSFIE